MNIPRCHLHGDTMEYRKPTSPEQSYCGAWYKCLFPGCEYTVLIPSKEVRTIYGIEEDETHE